MKTILHITADYPDQYSNKKTQAIQNLLRNTKGFQHLIYSINRQSGVGGVQSVDRRNNVITVCYRAPPFGIFLETFLSKLADWITADLRNTNANVHILHAHKLSIEGLVAQRVSKVLGGVPFICTIRGNTDQKYLRAKLDKRGTYRRLVRDARLLLPVTPWIERYVDQTLETENIEKLLLPTISQSTNLIPPQRGNGRLVTVFNLSGWRLKGIPNLLTTVANLKSTGTIVQLDIVGGGEPHHIQAIQKRIKKHDLADQVRLTGAIAHTEIQTRLNEYTGFLLPTLRETFGMVYLEALTAGLPILYSQERGVDGFFDGREIGVRCDPKSVPSLEAALRQMVENEEPMKAELAKCQTEGYFRRFEAEQVCKSYSDALHSILENEHAKIA
ncbi:glycosyltransferase [Ruegeria sp. AU67]|uniref:glycosyltransferase n=1 Tax=Ruegeria sp. AU67 TaxID=2108530 RepID=UPI000D69A3CF|nr:glycosyltransferase [Ruegeria sp. AU67]